MSRLKNNDNETDRIQRSRRKLAKKYSTEKMTTMIKRFREKNMIDVEECQMAKIRAIAYEGKDDPTVDNETVTLATASLNPITKDERRQIRSSIK